MCCYNCDTSNKTFWCPLVPLRYISSVQNSKGVRIRTILLDLNIIPWLWHGQRQQMETEHLYPLNPWDMDHHNYISPEQWRWFLCKKVKETNRKSKLQPKSFSAAYANDYLFKSVSFSLRQFWGLWLFFPAECLNSRT